MRAGEVVSIVIKLAVISLIVGLILEWLNLSPREVLERGGDWLRDLFGVGASFLDWALTYMLVGAAVVIPVWLIWKALGFIRRR